MKRAWACEMACSRRCWRASMDWAAWRARTPVLRSSAAWICAGSASRCSRCGVCNRKSLKPCRMASAAWPSSPGDTMIRAGMPPSSSSASKAVPSTMLRTASTTSVCWRASIRRAWAREGATSTVQSSQGSTSAWTTACAWTESPSIKRTEMGMGRSGIPDAVGTQTPCDTERDNGRRLCGQQERTTAMGRGTGVSTGAGCLWVAGPAAGQAHCRAPAPRKPGPSTMATLQSANAQPAPGGRGPQDHKTVRRADQS